MIVYPSAVYIAFRLLGDSGFESYAVGGAVRDSLLGKKPSDWDIATSALPDEICRVFSSYNKIIIGIKHGTVAVIIDGSQIEITSFRKDGIYSDARHPEAVSFSASLKDDVMRRDFTVNALAADIDGNIIDYVGGIDDLNAGVLRCVGVADDRLNEDALRILRAMRFASELGFEIESETKLSMKANASLLSMISSERISAELGKTICGKSASLVLNEFSDVVAVIIPELEKTFGFVQHNPHHSLTVWQHTLEVLSHCSPIPALRWAALLHDIGKPACFTRDIFGIGHFKGHADKGVYISHDILSRLRMSKADTELILYLIKYHYPIPAPSIKSVKKLLRKVGVDRFFLLTELMRADNMGKHIFDADNENKLAKQKEKVELCVSLLSRVDETAREILSSHDCFSLRDLDINGDDLIKLGYRGKDIGRALDFLLDAVISGEVSNNKEELISHLEKKR
ncbi:MAG: HD domain-containing protein [Ruminococcaceae bacterium]|nr:HD domain-containing protein [Oscillospiraceae bacterium]